MKVLLVPHVGETVGHLARCLEIADRIEQLGAAVTVAASSRWRSLYRGAPRRAVLDLDWPFSHNSLPDTGSAAVLAGAASIPPLIRSVQPDVIIGDPGVFTAPFAAAARIPHLAILHTAWLLPLTPLDRGSAVESALLDFVVRYAGSTIDPSLQAIAARFGVPELTYEEIVRGGSVLAVQPASTLIAGSATRAVGFVPASVGTTPPDAADASGAVLISLGGRTGPTTDRIVESTAGLASRVLLARRDHSGGPLPANVILVDPRPIRDLAPHLRAAITHGGMGLLASLAVARVRHMIVPGDVTQATAALLGERLAIASQVGLECWAAQARPGRLRLDIAAEEVDRAVRGLMAAPTPPLVDDGDGAARIAEGVVRGWPA